jgi:single-stranded DNA-binding protein|tara:strand:- start:556 stop:900 length:345 start_codon:yes stop_codon:yes gene_type:complete
MFNCTITGNLTGDAEFAQVGAYDTAKFTIAVNHNKDEVSYVSCTIFGKAWSSVVDSFKKGLKVTVHGKVTGLYNYMNKENEPASKINFNVTDFDYPHNIKVNKQATLDSAAIPF